MELHRKVIDWKLCIQFLMSSSQLETFVKNNQLESKLREIAVIAVNNAHEKDITKLVFTVFHEFNSDIAVNLQEQMRSMFVFSIKKKLSLVTKRN